MKITSRRLHLALVSGVLLSIIAFIVIAYFGLSILGAKSQKIVDLKVQTQTAGDQLANLESSKKQIEQYSYFKNVAQTVIPSDKDQAETVLEIEQMANNAGIQLQSITFPASNLGLTTSAAQDATSTSASQAAISQAQPVAGMAGLYSLQLTITPDSSTNVPPAKQITYAKMLAFLNEIENNRRTAQITQVNIQPPSQNLPLSFSLIINIFIKP